MYKQGFSATQTLLYTLTGLYLVDALSRSARKKNQWVEGIIKTLQSQKPISSLDLHIPKRKVQRTISMKNMRYINRILKVRIFILNINPSRKELSQGRKIKLGQLGQNLGRICKFYPTLQTKNSPSRRTPRSYVNRTQ